MQVASPPEAWIETGISENKPECIGSPPPRRRGLKLCGLAKQVVLKKVASPPEAWIETANGSNNGYCAEVASPPEAWIETVSYASCQSGTRPGASASARATISSSQTGISARWSR